MNRIRVIIAEDEPLARKGIRSHLMHHPDFELVAECSNGLQAVAAIREKNPQLVFLDIHMPRLDGLGVCRTIGAAMPDVIFVTAYDRYAIRAFEQQALDYILKPFERERFEQALDRARRRISAGPGDTNSRLLTLLEQIKTPPKYLERIAIKSGGRIIFVNTDEIDWIESEANYVRLHVAGAAHLLRETISALESRLDPDKFTRIRRSTIVNVRRIQEIQPLFNGEHAVILRGGVELRWSRRFREALENLLGRS